MRKKAGELKAGEKIKIGEDVFKIDEIEKSEISKQGVKKCRIVAKKENGEKIVLIRPDDYPINMEND